jgi:transcriptional regulator
MILTLRPDSIRLGGMKKLQLQRTDLLQGTLDLLVLRTLIFGPLHGYGIAKAIHQTSNEALRIEFGSLYPALRRLELKGWISSKWETSDRNRKAKFYRLTSAGKRQLVKEESKWEQFVAAMSGVLKSDPRVSQS